MEYWAFYLGGPPRTSGVWDDDYRLTDGYTSPQRVYTDIVDEAVLAEELGYTGIWLAEHHFASNYSLIPNPLALLMAIAARTQRLRLGAGVTCIPEHHPVRVAEDIGLLDQLSGGRVDTAIGRGVFPDEYGGLSVDIADSKERYVEGLDLLLRLFNETDVEHDGPAWPLLAPVSVAPEPIQKPHPPLWLAANSLDTIGMALDRKMDVVFNVGVFGISRLGETRESFLRQCEERTIDPSTVRFGAQVWASYAPNSERVEKAAHAARVVMRSAGRRIGAPRQYTKDGIVDLSTPDDGSDLGQLAEGDLQYSSADGEASTEDIVETNMIGDDDRILEQIETYKSLGITDLILIIDTGDISRDERRESLQRFSTLLFDGS